MQASATSALERHFGYQRFRPGQAEAVNAVLAGRDTLVVMPTGAGKSLVYQLPALALPGVTLIVSPLVALMKDQVDHLVALGKPATYINSSLPAEEQTARVQWLAQGAYKLVYVAPERLRHRVFLQALLAAGVSRVAVDEAHCISQWGHDFRPDYLSLGQVVAGLGHPPTVALTATATPQVQDDIVQRLDLRDPLRLVTGFNRPNLFFEVRPAPDDAAKLRELSALLDSDPGPAIVYTGTRKDAETVGQYLAGLGIAAAFYHAGLDADTRRRVQDSFMQDTTRVIVATNAFGMGVDKPDIRLVVHHSLPSSLEAYYQEAGRAGRDDRPARCVLLYAAKDRGLQEWFIENDSPTQYELRYLLTTLRRFARDDQVRVSDAELTRATRLPDVKLRVGLSQLAQLGAIVHLGDDVGSMRFEVPPHTHDFDLAQAAADVAERRAHKREKLAQMVAYAEATTCRRRFVLAYFGDPSPPEAARCCDVCADHAQTPLTAYAAFKVGVPPEEGAALGAREASTTAEWALLIILEAVKSLASGVGRVKLAQMLAGSRAHALGQLTKHRLYGKLSFVGLAQLQTTIDQLVAAGYLKVISPESPQVILTPRGASALRARAAISLPPVDPGGPSLPLNHKS